MEMRGLVVPLYSTMGSYWSNWYVRKGGRSLCAEISHGKDQPLTTILAWSVSALNSAVEPPDAPMDAPLPFSRLNSAKLAHGRTPTIQPYVNDVSRFVFRAVSHAHIKEAMFDDDET